MTAGPTVSVVVPTYRRPEHLQRCLAALQRQSRGPDEIVVVYRAGDDETGAVLAATGDPRLVALTVAEPSVLVATVTGLRAATGDIVAFTDDDAAPHSDWLARMVRHFADPGVGGVGGRDIWITEPDAGVPTTDVGRITRWGKLIGNHHLGIGPARDVTVVKGCNAAFRREALAFPVRLRGIGAQAHHEVATCLWACGRGWRIVYDPAIAVDHYRAPRFDEGVRARPKPAAVKTASYNLVWALVSLRPEMLLRRALYGLLVGDRETPGVIRAGIALLRNERPVVAKLVPSLAGQATALQDYLVGKRVEMVTVTDLQSGESRPTEAGGNRESPRVGIRSSTNRRP